MLKPKHSAFLCTALPVLLHQLGVDGLVLAGVATDSCVLATALDLAQSMTASLRAEPAAAL